MTLQSSTTPAWVGEYRKNEDDHSAMLSRPRHKDRADPCGCHHQLEFDLTIGLSVLYINGPTCYSNGFIARAYDVADFKIIQSVPEGCPTGSASPWAGLHRVRGHAGWLLGKSWDAVSRDLRLAAEFLEKANTSTKTDLVEWDSISQGEWLGAVRLLMLIHDFDAARTLLKKKRRFGHVVDEYRLLTTLLAASDPRGDAALLDQFDRFYDPFRLPYPPSPWIDYHEFQEIRWELGLLRDQLFISPTGTPDLDRVITMIGT